MTKEAAEALVAQANQLVQGVVYKKSYRLYAVAVQMFAPSDDWFTELRAEAVYELGHVSRVSRQTRLLGYPWHNERQLAGWFVTLLLDVERDVMTDLLRGTTLDVGTPGT